MKLGGVSPTLATYVCGCVFRAERDVKTIVFDLDGTLQMMCGEIHDWEQDGVRHICAGPLLERHPALKDLEMSPGFVAELTEARVWRVESFMPEGDEA